MEHKSDVAWILTQMAQEYEAGKSDLQGLAQGQARRSFITARMENMGRLQTD